LERAWADALEPDEHVRLFLDEGAPMLELLRAAGNHEISSHRAQRLLHVAESATHVPTEIARQHAPSAQHGTLVDPLSDRELHVLRLLGSDLSGPAIANELFVSLNTFRTHTKRIFTKLDVTSRREAVSRGRELGLR
jgi:LuxR family maltose regulon positive regulatory protein